MINLVACYYEQPNPLHYFDPISRALAKTIVTLPFLTTATDFNLVLKYIAMNILSSYQVHLKTRHYLCIYLKIRPANAFCKFLP